MTPERWRQIESLYDQALEIDPSRRVEFLDEACGGDIDLRRALERLLSEKPQRGSFLEKPAIKEIAEEFAATIGSSWVGVQIGNYQLVSLAGAGGMGEVYRARDTKLKRDVAIKILPEEFSSDPDRVSRFQREAELLASLNHPNIAAIYDLEEADSHRFLILELVEGETLADRIKRGPIPAEEALRIALQIAEALEAAHEKSVIHRDLKPANIKVTAGGKVKVLDFGLAKALLGDAGVNLSNSPTVSMAATQQGVILGTAAYMSPEQARGQAVDRRADVWAFGCVLFEMLSGCGTFSGKTVSDVIASVLKTAPEWSSLPANLHPRILHLLERCLEKEPQNRSQGLADARFEINKVLANPDGVLARPPMEARPGLRSRLPWVAAIVIAAALGSILVWVFKPAAPVLFAKFPFSLPEPRILPHTILSALAISRDGTRLAYLADDQVYLSNPNAMDPQPIPGPRIGMGQPVFSPDGQWLVYLGGGGGDFPSLKKIPVGGGTAITLIEDPQFPVLDVSWKANDTILFASTEGILGIRDGGRPTVLVKAAVGETLGSPELLPGGEALLFSATTATLGANRWNSAQIFVQRLESDTRKLVWKGGDPHYITTGHIVYAQRNTLFAIPFDIDGLEVKGDPAPIAEAVRRSIDGTSDTANYDISDSGTLVYITQAASPSPAGGVLALVDRNGIQQKLNVLTRPYRNPHFSPDGNQVAVEIIANDRPSSIWVYDLLGNSEIRELTQPASNNTKAIWRDSKTVTFASDRNGTWRMYSQRTDRGAEPEPLATGEQGIQQVPGSWAPDGRTLSYAKTGPKDWSIWTYSMDSRISTLFHDTPGLNDFGSAFSPDGDWISFSVGSNPPAIHAKPFPTGESHRVSEGVMAIWSRQNELFFLPAVVQQIVRMMALDVSTKGTFDISNRRTLSFQNVLNFPAYINYDISPDGKHFVMIVPGEPAPAPAPPRINIVLNFFEEVKTRVLPR